VAADRRAGGYELPVEVKKPGDVIEKGEHFFLTEHDGQFVGPADAREILVGPRHLQGGQ